MSFSATASGSNDCKATRAEEKIITEAESDGSLKVKLKQRSGKRSSVTKTVNKINADTDLNTTDVKFYIGKLDTLSASLRSLDTEIEVLMFSQDLFSERVCSYEEYTELCEVYSDKIMRIRLELEEKLRDLPVNGTVKVNHNNRGPAPRLKLPEIELPKFDGQPESYERFINSFEEIISKFDLTTFEKYSYLLQRLSGPAKQIVESVPSGDLKYESAKKLLNDAFSSHVVQQYSVISKLVNLKLNSVKNAYKWISEARILADQVQRLEIGGDVFVQFFLWNGLSEKFKFQYINIINKAKPSLDEILAESFEVFNRMKDSEMPIEVGHTSEKRLDKSVTLATNISYKSGPDQPGSRSQNLHQPGPSHSQPDMSRRMGNYECLLCKSAHKPNYQDHRVFHCPVFKTPEEKLDYIKRQKGCIRCGLLNHEITNCKYKFSGKCRRCDKYHAYFLCNVKSDQGESDNFKNVNKNNKNKPYKVNTNVIQFSVMQTSSQSDILIPTFTVKFNNNDNYFRTMYDTASQTSFISQAAYDKIKPTIVQSGLRIQVVGFVNTKTFDTQIVKLDLNIEGKIRSFNAVVVPEIRTSVSTQLGEIVDAFKKADIPLADKFLNGDYSGAVDVLLGVDSAHVLPVHSCSFGMSDLPSCSYHTCLGVMLAGRVDALRGNLEHLHLLKTYNEKLKLLT